MSKLGYVLIILVCFIVWVLVAGSFTLGLVDVTVENMFRVFVGSLVTAFTIFNASKLYKVGKLL